MTPPIPPFNFSKSGRRKAVEEAHQEVNETNEQLGSAREVFGPSHPTVKKLVADSTEKVTKRREAIKRLREGS